MEYLTVKEAALVAKVHWQTVGDALRDGELHGGHRAKGGVWRINSECLDAWLMGAECSHGMGKKVAA